jgi:hypothetical protein
MNPFTTTREIAAGMDPWIAAFAANHLPLVRVPPQAGSYYWRFRDENAHALLVGKAVRIVTGTRGSIAASKTKK